MTFRHPWRRVLAATAVIAGAVFAVPTAAQANPEHGIALFGGPNCTLDYVLAGWQLTNTNPIPATVMQVDAGPVELSGIAVGSVIPAAVDGQTGTLTGTQEFSPAYDGPFTLSVTVNIGVQFATLSLSYTIDDECEPDYDGPGLPTTPPTQGPPTSGPPATTAPPTPEPTATQPPATLVPTTPAAGPSLPVTGGDPLPIVAAGLALVTGGGLLALVIARRRRSRFVS
ncbi:hypothetical protein [Phytohabitans houttuyneae]|uniref:Gram-positive cocci surface proteins LPxTG domain-containing protein n=1 Tax=Phytohabitans houttuyneae TaxID=1076126 RepID=A0A6V8KB77_9ACTN|nr:hypothetical protein [Phytohabitans houttuyneae]GFJ82492.1 hypothetical protein Phou_066720 [Phytohabitans houttuyneae]